jgi:glutaredoxin 3
MNRIRISSSSSITPLTVLFEGSNNKSPMKRPLLDQIATTLFQLETQRVASSSVMDEQGRYGEPMEWSNRTSLANQFSVFIASNPIGYMFKQTVANLVAGDYNETMITSQINQYIQQDTVVMFSFTTCPFCRKAKDLLDERNISYTAIELDTMDDTDNRGNIIRAQLGKLTKRTSMPNIFIRGQCIGGCNDGYPGLIPLIENNQLDALLL